MGEPFLHFSPYFYAVSYDLHRKLADVFWTRLFIHPDRRDRLSIADILHHYGIFRWSFPRIPRIENEYCWRTEYKIVLTLRKFKQVARTLVRIAGCKRTEVRTTLKKLPKTQFMTFWMPFVKRVFLTIFITDWTCACYDRNILSQYKLQNKFNSGNSDGVDYNLTTVVGGTFTWTFILIYSSLVKIHKSIIIFIFDKKTKKCNN